MVEPIKISTTSAVPNATQSSAPKVGESSGLAFRALLDQLADRARELEQTSTKPVDARDLAGAVEQAHGSLQEALHLSAQLLEAYRANVQTRPQNPSRQES